MSGEIIPWELPDQPAPVHDRAGAWWAAFARHLAETLGESCVLKPYAPRPVDGEGLYISHGVRLVYRPPTGRDVVVQTDLLSGGLAVAVPQPIHNQDPAGAVDDLARTMRGAIRYAKEAEAMEEARRTTHDERPPEYAMPPAEYTVPPAPEGVGEWEHLDNVKRARMSRLCDCFPTLRGLPGTDPFDYDLIINQSGGSGLRHAVAFAVSVWGRTSFDASGALMSWDRSHRAAYAVWAADPWWC